MIVASVSFELKIHQLQSQHVARGAVTSLTFTQLSLFGAFHIVGVLYLFMEGEVKHASL